MIVAPDAIRARLRDRSACVAVIGAGYVGLPLAVAYADAGFKVIAVDVQPQRIAALKAGTSYIQDVPASRIAAHVRAGRLRATADYDALRDADVIFVAVPTPLDRAKQPDLSFITAAAHGIAERLRPGHLIILESTTYPGTTDEVLRPILEATGLRVGTDFFLAFSPERIDPGNTTYRIENTPKVVGGVDPESTGLAAEALRQVIPHGHVRTVSSARAAELTKLLENTFRAVNIALVNELAKLCDRMGIDVWEVIDAAGTKPYGFMPFYPGPGVGGHCLATGESVLVRRGSAVMPLPVDEIWADATGRAEIITTNGIESVPQPGLDVMGIGIDGPAGWEQVTALFRRTYVGELVTVRLVDGREVSVTAGHPMLAAGPDGVAVRRAGSLVPGDLIPVLGPLRGDGEDPSVDVIDGIAPGLRARVRAERTDGGSWAEQESEVRRRWGASRTHDWMRSGRLPLEAYLDLERDGVPVPPRSALRLWTGRGPGCVSIGAQVRLTPDVARLIGYYATEGCITIDGSQRVRFTVHPEEKELVADLCGILRSLGQRWSVSEDRKSRSLHVKVSSALFATLIRDVLGCGVSSYDAAVPGVLLGASERHRLALFTGLLRGDGSVHARSGLRTYRHRGREARSNDACVQVAFWTTSPVLERQFSYLTQTLGFRTSIHRRAHQPGADFRFHDASRQPELLALFLDAKRERFAAALAHKRRTPRSRGKWAMAGQSVVAVKAVERRQAAITVFSVETAITHTFATGHGLFVHNCIPVDPYFLAWKAREYDFHTKFIELAAETNLGMPFFTVGRIRRVLDRSGKSLRGARVLVVGASFKPDVSDDRGSAAIRVMEVLASEGADVSYHDPFVPSIRMRTAPFGAGDSFATFESVPLDAAHLAAADVVALLVGHSKLDIDLVLAHASLVFDAVNATRGRSGRAHVERL